MDLSGNRRIGWGVRPLDWDDDNYERSSDSDNDEEVLAKSNHDDAEMEDKEFARWVSSKWNLQDFDENLPVSERKNEWERFSEQFERIIGVRQLSSKQKLQALRIQAGQYLNDIIKMQRKRTNLAEECYEKVMADLNIYFDQTCDAMQERAKFREMKMSPEESFVDYELRCEKQMKYCNFSKIQADEELADALIRRSVPEISKQLRLLAPTFQNDIFSIIKQGTHLDHIRKEEYHKSQEVEAKPVMSVRREFAPKYNVNQYHRPAPYQKQYHDKRESPIRNWVPRSRNPTFSRSRSVTCGKCSEHHEIGNCPAQGRRCTNCKRWGHFSKCCKATSTRDHEIPIKEEVKNINQVKFGKENGFNEGPNEEH